MQMLQIELPDELLTTASDADLEVLARHTEALAREALLVRLYDLRRVSAVRAAKLLGIPEELHNAQDARDLVITHISEPDAKLRHPMVQRLLRINPDHGRRSNGECTDP